MTKKINFTEEAIKQIEKIISGKEAAKYFRISVKGGGCSGFKFDFSFDQTKQKNDHIFNNDIHLTTQLIKL